LEAGQAERQQPQQRCKGQQQDGTDLHQQTATGRRLQPLKTEIDGDRQNRGGKLNTISEQHVVTKHLSAASERTRPGHPASA
jgi:hypothetical protein